MENHAQIEAAKEELEIDLLEIFDLFRQKLKYIILFFLLGGILAGLGSFLLIDPTYEATAKLYIVSASNDSVVNLSDLQIGTSLTADYNELVMSRPMLESVITNLDLADMTVRDLEKQIEVTNPSGTRILEITVTSTEPAMAVDIANEMAELAVEWLPEVMESNQPNIAEDAIMPTGKAGPSYVKFTALGALIFAVAYFAVCLIQYLMDDSIRSEDILEHYFGIVPLAAIPEEAFEAETTYLQNRQNHNSKPAAQKKGAKS